MSRLGLNKRIQPRQSRAHTCKLRMSFCKKPDGQPFVSGAVMGQFTVGFAPRFAGSSRTRAWVGYGAPPVSASTTSPRRISSTSPSRGGVMNSGLLVDLGQCG